MGGADAICQMEAAGKLPGTYRAWIASSGVVVPSAMDCASDRNVWTALDKDGNVVNDHCAGWQSESGDVYGHGGYLDAASEQWTSACLANCNSLQRLYCFQQAP